MEEKVQKIMCFLEKNSSIHRAESDSFGPLIHLKYFVTHCFQSTKQFFSDFKLFFVGLNFVSKVGWSIVKICSFLCSTLDDVLEDLPSKAIICYSLKSSDSKSLFNIFLDDLWDFNF